jgi:uncharacterized protein
MALTRLAHAVVPGMMERRWGVILNVSSTAGFQPIPQFSVYSATKAYVNTFSEALRAELRGTGIRVTALCPGPVETEFLEVAGGRTFSKAPRIVFASPARVAASALRAVRHDRPRVIPGVPMWLLILLSEVTPAWLFRVIFWLGRGILRRERARRRKKDY